MRTIDTLIKYEPKFKCLFPVDTKYETKCWEWEGQVWSNGYGRIGAERAHRIAYEIINGCIQTQGARLVLHKCDNKLCCRPDHLYLGTHSQNMLDMSFRGRASKNEDHVKTSITKYDVESIRFLSRIGFSYGSLEAIYSIPKSTISNIVKRTVWKNIKNKDFSKKEFIDYLKFRIRIGEPLCSPVRKDNSGTSGKIKSCSVGALREVTGLIGQIKLSEALGCGRKKLRIVLEYSDSVIVSLDSSGETNDLKEQKSGTVELSMTDVVNLITKYSQKI